jgi:hypothetical protein
MAGAATPSPDHRRVIVLADRIGATQHISFSQPLARLQRAGALSLEMHSDSKTWRSETVRQDLWAAWRPTVLVLSRYTDPRALDFVEMARKARVPIIAHLDDDLLDVPLSLGPDKYAYYHRPERLATLRAVLDAATLVYASTAPLGARLSEHGVTAPIVCGETYCSFDPTAMCVPLPATGPVVGYMGTGGHSEDLALAMPALVALMEEIPALRFETYGTIALPPEMAPFGSRYGHHAGVSDYAGFLDKLCDLGWWVGLAPLADNPFNRCKADTKWVEYSFAGIPVVASDVGVYAKACAGGAGMLVHDAKGWQPAMRALLLDRARRRTMVHRAQAGLSERYGREVLERQVLRVLAAVE